MIITGVAGGGKTTLINALRSLGYACVPEAAREIIRDQMTIGGRALHQVDPELFAEIMLSWEVRSYREATQLSGVVLFDRGIPDLIGYHRLIGLSVPPYVIAATNMYRYHTRVFVAPPWPEIYVNDEERTHGFDEVLRTHEAIASAYIEHGYEPIILPKVSVAERVAFVRQYLP
ncbi:putative ATPase [Actinocrispum wychmicini]|uniref:Putative ATPase n=1 Tax=Actinocrispum wychmicini TaxID=1213861 RepID=A0A4R2JBN2_9PSEU|nr:putative ATPase [Actinocrispum wychmicini]